MQDFRMEHKRCHGYADGHSDLRAVAVLAVHLLIELDTQVTLTLC